MSEVVRTLAVSAKQLREVSIGEAINDPGKLTDELVQGERDDHDGHCDRHGLQQGSKNLHKVDDVIHRDTSKSDSVANVRQLTHPPRIATGVGVG